MVDEEDDEDEAAPPPAQNIPVNAEQADRITLVVQATHESFGEQPVGIDHRRSIICENREEPFQRRVRHSETVAALVPVQPVEHPGLVLIENRIPATRTNPTPEEIADRAKKVLVIEPAGIRIRPGSLAIVEFTDVNALLARCENGEVEVHVTIFPR